MLKLNIYNDDNSSIVRVAEGDTVDLTYGTVEDFFDLFDGITADGKIDNVKIFKQMRTVWKDLTPILLEMFPDLTSDDLRHVKMKEVLALIPSIVGFSNDTLDKNLPKNAVREKTK